MPAILRERHLYPPVSTSVALRREDATGKLQWLHPLAQMYVTTPGDQTPAQRTGLLVLIIATPVLALLILLFILTFRKRAKERAAREQGFQISDPQLILVEPAKTYIPQTDSDMVKIPPVMGGVDERPIISMPEPQPYVHRPGSGGSPIGALPSLEVTPPSQPPSHAATPNTPRTLQVPRTPGFTTPQSPRSPRSPHGHHHPIPPGTPFGDVSDQPLSANSLERMMTRMESDLKSPVPRSRRF